MSEPTDHDPSSTTEGASAADRSAEDLLAQLAEEFADRYRRGERPAIDEYARAHPALADRIRDLFPALVAIEQSALEPAPPAEPVGAVVGGRYKLLERLGEGGFGVVFMAEQLAPVRRRVALKVIKPGLDTRHVIARFEAERQALAMMDHENIARVLDAGATDSGRPYFVMELVRGVPITQYCDANRLAPRDRLELFVNVCRAVQHAHTKGIIHRDLKPTNILVTLHDGVPVPKVIDFGVAKATAAHQPLTDRTLFTHFAQMVGTPLYMSPEQAEFSGLDVDTRSDVYSLGVVLYELLTGTTPFDKQRLARAAYDEVRRIIREEEPPRPSTRLSTLGDAIASVSATRQTDPKRLGQLVRGELDWVVMRALEKDRRRRYVTANALARDVERYLADEPVEACPPSRLYRLRKSLRRHRVPLAVAAGFVLLLALATAVSTWQAIRASRAERQVRRERDRALAEKDRADRAAHTAHNVAHYLGGIIGTANLGSAPQPPIETVRQMLDDFGERFQGKLDDDPAAEATLRTVIGSLYFDLGELEKAENHIAQACERRRRAVGDQDIQYAGLLQYYALVLRRQSGQGRDRWAQAEALTRQALAIYQSAGSKDGTLNCLWTLKLIFEGQRRYRERNAVRDQWIALARQTPGVRGLHAELGAVALSNRAYAEAEAHFRRELEAELPLPHGGSAPWAYWGLADALSGQHRFAESLDALCEALAIFRRTRPLNHPESTGVTLDRLTNTVEAARDASALAKSLGSMDRIEQLESLYRRSATTRPTTPSPHDTAMLTTRGLLVLADVCLHLSGEWEAAGKPGEAARAREKSAALIESVRGRVGDHAAWFSQTHPEAIAVLEHLGMRDQARTIARRLLDEPAVKDPGRLNGLAWTLVATADTAHRAPAVAVELAEKAVELSPGNANLHNTLGVARYRAGGYRGAVAALKRSAQLRKGGDSFDFFFLAMAHHRLGDTGAARRWHEKAVRWMHERAAKDPELIRFRSEADRTLFAASGTPATRPTGDIAAGGAK